MSSARTFSVGLVALALCLSTLSHANAGVWRDDFEDGDYNGWRLMTGGFDDISPWSVVNGRLSCRSDNSTSSILFVGDASWGGDYTVRVDMNLLEDTGPSQRSGDVDVVARADMRKTESGGTEVDGVGFFIGTPPQSSYATHLNAYSPTFAELPALSMNAWHHLQLDAKGNEFVLSVDGAKVFTYKDDKYAAGGIGVGVARYTVRFDNVEVVGPNVPDRTPLTWTGTPVEPEGRMTTTWGKLKAHR